ncbi:MAG: hypothetical protein ABI638_13450 [Ignavibacteriota bacterium]
MKIYLLIFLAAFIFGCNSSILDDPSTTIQYSIPEPSHVKLTVENSYDTIIAVLVDGDLQAGSFQVNFDTNKLAEGIYFYTLEIKTQSGNNSKMIRNMLLIK